MLELMYASGLRVSEMVDLKTIEVGLNEGVVRIVSGKGGKERLVPFGAEAAVWLKKYLVVKDKKSTQGYSRFVFSKAYRARYD